MRKPSKPLNQDPEAVRQAIQDSGRTKYALAKFLGCSRSLLTEIEKGTRNARPELLRQMAEVFDCPVSQLQAKTDGAAGETATAADVAVRELRVDERTVAGELPELRA